ncbi:DnaD domain protein [Paenibacillus sp. DMB20]|uniref:DnaD domain protein n=1 Tax=Paenibacillus sp. DMB20 TaxID=1642570 RepID=UPI0006276EEE|nr:DnaD domain protein [Paenibacillus sp. DMB20]KKO51129.1 hypothetical protein XI25_29525 [Paenibacillus sp. DMB20]
MARKVYVSSDMSADETLIDIAEIDPVANLLWPWFITAFDDWGRAQAAPKRIKNTIFPANDLVTVETINNALSLYHDHKLIQLYAVDGKEYMSINPEKWFKWQTHIRKEKRETDGSKCPPPAEDDNSAQPRASARDIAESSENAINRAALTAQGARDSAGLRANLTDCIPSPSLSPSPSPSIKTCSSSSGGNPFTLYESHQFGKIDDLTKDFICETIETYTEPFVIRAMKEAVIQNKIAWSYVQSILKRWKDTGHPEPWTLEKPQTPQNTVPFNKYRKSDKPIIPVAQEVTQGQVYTDEEYEEAMRLAAELKASKKRSVNE